MTLRTMSLLFTLALLGALAVAASSADARRGGDSRVVANGTCSGNSTAKLKAKADDGRIEAEFEVDQNRSGVRWQVRLRHDGDAVARTHRTTAPPSGSFSLERRLPNHSGSDRITAFAKRANGETCRASLSF